MKRRTQLISLMFLFIGTTIIVSCSKNQDVNSSFSSPTPPPPPPILSDSLSGKEFIFPDSTWVVEYDGFMDLPQVLIKTPSRPNLFDRYRRMEVYFQPDSSTVWIPAISGYGCCINSEYFWYYVSDYRLRILSNLISSQMPGKKATIKVKFL